MICAISAARLGRITAGYSREDGKPVTAEDLRAAGAMAVLLKDALKPNLVQTLEGQPALVHCGPLGITDHGNNSLVADLVALRLGEYAVTECGFGSDMGMEKFFNLVCRVGNLTPAAAVLVISARAVRHHGGVAEDAPADRRASLNAIEVGMANVRRHLGIIEAFGVPAVVAINRRAGDTNEEIELLKRLAVDAGAFAACVNDGFARGGAGASELAEAVVRGMRDSPPDSTTSTATMSRSRTRWRPSRGGSTAPRTCSGIPRPSRSSRSSLARDWQASRCASPRPICRCPPTPSLLNAPEGFTLPVRDIRAYTGAGWLVPLCGEITQMPGLGKTPGAAGVDIDAEGRTVGLF